MVEELRAGQALSGYHFPSDTLVGGRKPEESPNRLQEINDKMGRFSGFFTSGHQFDQSFNVLKFLNTMED